jgi:hypothetical protein
MRPPSTAVWSGVWTLVLQAIYPQSTMWRAPFLAKQAMPLSAAPASKAGDFPMASNKSSPGMPLHSLRVLGT